MADAPHLDPVPDQLPLGFEEPEYDNLTLRTSEIRVGGFGSPPDRGLVESVRTFGVMVPILVSGPDGGPYDVVDGRRRLLAAVQAGHTSVPARVVSGGGPFAAMGLTLAGNVHSCPNPVVELRAIEEMMLQSTVEGRKPRAGEIARATGIKLDTVRRRLKLQRLVGELRDAWEEGRFGTRVGEAAAKLDEDQQRELVRRLEANGTVTYDDVTDVRRKTKVSEHERSLPEDPQQVRRRSLERLHDVEGDLTLTLGLTGEHPAVEAVRDAIEALEREDE